MYATRVQVYANLLQAIATTGLLMAVGPQHLSLHCIHSIPDWPDAQLTESRSWCLATFGDVSRGIYFFAMSSDQATTIARPPDCNAHQIIYMSPARMSSRLSYLTHCPHTSSSAQCSLPASSLSAC